MSAASQTRAETAPVDRVLEIVRIFDAPRQMVWDAWTDPAQALKWMGPRDYPAVHMEGDLRPGGAWRGCLRSTQTGEDLWQSGVYRDVEEPSRLVWTFAWDDRDGRRGSESVITVTFADEGAGTRMIFRQEPFDTVESRDGHRSGWTSTFDRLDELLAAR